MAGNVYDHPFTWMLIRGALEEDLEDGHDLTTETLVPPDARMKALVRAKQPGVIVGMPLFERVFRRAGGGVVIHDIVADGTHVEAGTEVLHCTGNARTLLVAERTALNIAQRLSGNATQAKRYVDAVAGTKAVILDTRKTIPGMRLLQKHAVQCGGAKNHRMGLYDQVLIKDNHIALMEGSAQNSPAEAVRRCRARLGAQTIVEVEIEFLRDLLPVISAGANIVLLDNMDVPTMREAVQLRDRAGASGVLLEASGGISIENVREVAETGVDRISIGKLTHSVPALDLSMRTEIIR